MRRFFITVVLVLMFAALAVAANEIHFPFARDQYLYCRIIQFDTLKTYDTGIADYNDVPANWADAAIDLTESANIQNLYLADMPVGSAAGLYHIMIHSGTAAAAQSSDAFVGSFDLPFDGSKEISLADVVDADGRVDIGRKGGEQLKYQTTLASSMQSGHSYIVVDDDTGFSPGKILHITGGAEDYTGVLMAKDISNPWWFVSPAPNPNSQLHFVGADVTVFSDIAPAHVDAVSIRGVTPNFAIRSAVFDNSNRTLWTDDWGRTYIAPDGLDYLVDPPATSSELGTVSDKIDAIPTMPGRPGVR